MGKNLFDFQDYPAYLKSAFPTRGAGRGSRIRLANALGVQKGFISAVFHGKAEFSLEQAYKVSRFLSHTPDERDYFLLLIQSARAGSQDLREYFGAKIRETQAKRKEIRERISVKATLSEVDQLTYYSNWHYTAIHMCLMVPQLRSREAISRYLGLPIELVSKVLEFFVRSGIAEQRGESYVAGPARLHIGADSPFVGRHHTNWRMQSIQALDRSKTQNLHYSLVMSIAPAAMTRIREILLDSLQKTEAVLRDSPDETICALTLDLYELNRS